MELPHVLVIQPRPMLNARGRGDLARLAIVTRIRTTFSAFLSRSSLPEATVKWVSFGQRNGPFRIPMHQQNHPRYIVSVEKEVPGDHLLHFFPFARMLPHQLSLLQLFLVASVAFAQKLESRFFRCDTARCHNTVSSNMVATRNGGGFLEFWMGVLP